MDTAPPDAPGTPRTSNRVLEGYQVSSGSFDEARDDSGTWRSAWRTPLERIDALGEEEVAARLHRAQRWIRENGITHNAFGASSGVDRPWPLDAVPCVISSDDWRRISTGLIQRVRALEALLADIYGPRLLVDAGALPWSVIASDPAYLRSCHGLRYPDDRPLPLYAADLGRGRDGRWRVLADHAGPLVGAGYALENRLAVSRMFPNKFRDCGVHRLAEFFAKVKDLLVRLSPRVENPRIVFLSGGPQDPMYFEHVYLSRYLGFTLAEAADLTVREDTLYLKTLRGLYPVDSVLRRLPDGLCDPLEFGGDADQGVAAFLRAVRAGKLAVANPLGASIIESPWVGRLLPELAPRLIGEDLSLEPGLQGFSLSGAPAWSDGGAVCRHIILRAFLVGVPGGHSVMSGGLTLTTASPESRDALARGGEGSKDTWVLSDAPVSTFSLLRPSAEPITLIRGGYYLPSRVAENLYWLGRYAERAEGTIRLLEVVVGYLSDDLAGERSSRLGVILDAIRGLLLPNDPDGRLAAPRLEETVLDLVFDPILRASLRSTVTDMEASALKVRDRLAQDTWLAISNLGAKLDEARQTTRSAGDALEALGRGRSSLEAFGGLVAESMTRGLGWHFLDMGRRLERATQTIRILSSSWVRAGPDPTAAIEPILQVTNSLLTYRSRYLTHLQAGPAIDLVVIDETNPRSVAFQLRELQSHEAGVSASAAPVERSEEARLILRALTEVRLSDPYLLGSVGPQSARESLGALLGVLAADLPAISDALTRHYFSPARQTPTESHGGP